MVASHAAGLKTISTGCNSIRSADIPLMCTILDQRTELHFMRLLTQNNPIGDLIPDKADEIANEDDLLIL
jgi:hypothetical protein